VDRVQAMNLLKEIASKIPEMDPKVISMVESEPNNLLQIGFRINFKGLSSDCKGKIKLIATNHSLAILDNEIDLVIYAPIRGCNY
jgi:hypothetical protein